MSMSTLPEAETVQAAYRERPARYSVRWPVTISEPAFGSHRGMLVNLSISGVRFVSSWSHAIGERVQIRTDVNHLPRLDFTVEITRIQSTRSSKSVYGAKIVTISDPHRHRLRYVLQALQGKQFDLACTTGTLRCAPREEERPRRQARITASGYASRVETQCRRQETFREGVRRSATLATVAMLLLVLGRGLSAPLVRHINLFSGLSFCRLEPETDFAPPILIGDPGLKRLAQSGIEMRRCSVL